MIAAAAWCAVKAVLLAFAHTYANLDFLPVVPWLVLAQVVCYAAVLWHLRQTFRRNRAPRAVFVYSAIFLTLSTTLSCTGILTHNATRDVLPGQAKMPTGNPLGNAFSMSGIFSGTAPEPPPESVASMVEHDGNMGVPEISARRVASGSFLRRLGFFCRNLADNSLRLKMLVALLILPVGLLINRDLLWTYFEPVVAEAKVMVAMVWILAVLPALILGWLYGFLVFWCVWAGLGNLAAIVAYRLALRDPDPQL
jgi:hypothetical protein